MSILEDALWEAQPKFNPIIANGIVNKHMEEVEAFIDGVFRITSRSYREGLIYKGFKRCTPEEEIREILLQRSKRTIELSKSNVYLVNYLFEYDGQEIVKPIYLPYVNQAGQIYLRDTSQTILPILSDGGLSVSKGTIFVGLLAIKLTFRRVAYSFYLDDYITNNYVVYCKAYNKNPADRPHYKTRRDDTVSMEHATVAYLFGKYGFHGTMKKYFPEVEYHVFDHPIDKKKYPISEYHHIRSLGTQPKRNKFDNYLRNPLQMVIKKEHYTPELETVITGFYYVTDHYSHRTYDVEWLDSVDMWRGILGHAIFKTNEGLGKVLAEMQRHYMFIDHYLDDFFKRELRDEGIICDDLYDLFMYLVQNFTNIVLDTDVGQMYNKKPVVLRHVLSNIIEGANKFKFAMQEDEGSTRRRPTVQDINRELGKALQPDAIFGITGTKHPEVCTVQTAGDCYVFSYTSSTLRQEKATRNTGKDRINLSDPVNHLHASILEVGSVLNLPKSDPIGWAHLNVYMQGFKVNGVFKPHPKWKPIIDRIRKLTTRV